MQLDRVRGSAFARDDEPALSEVYADPSPALQADLETLRRVDADGHRVQGLHYEITVDSVSAADGSHVRLRVRDVEDPYDVVDSQGRVVEHGPGRGEVAYDEDLVRTAAGWRAVRLHPVAAG